jgi:hypothetical protein
VRRLRLRVGRGQRIGQPRPGPAGGRRGTRTPSSLAWDVAHLDQASSAIAGALQRDHELDLLKAVAQLVQGQLQGPLDQSVHA